MRICVYEYPYIWQVALRNLFMKNTAWLRNLFMKNTAWLFLAIVCISAMITSQALASEADDDVKKTHWKMSKAQVKRSIQKKPIKEEASFLIYQYVIFDSNCFVLYNFAPTGEPLAEVSYVFKPISQSHAGHIYSQLSAQIVKEYLRVHDPKAPGSSHQKY
jgi:hypothetical protein